MTRITTLTALFLTCAALAACGGGGGGGDSSTTNPVTPPPPPAQAVVTNFNASGATPTEAHAVVSGESIVLNWSTENASSCTLSGGNASDVLAFGQQTLTAPTVTAPTVNTYSLVCGNSAIATTSIQVLPTKTAIPDAGLQHALQAQGLTVGTDGTIDTTAALAVTDLEIQQDYGIVDLTGLAAFQGLTKLQIWHNTALTNVSDVSSLTSLTWLDIWTGAFTSIDVSRLTNLTTLGVSMIDGLPTVDISKNVKLTELDFQNDNDDVNTPWGKTKGLTSLDISHNVNLERVYIGLNLLSSIDTFKNAHLAEAWFEGNQFTSLDFSHNSQLTYAVLYSCPKLTTLNLKGINSGGLPDRLNLDSDLALTAVNVTNPTQYTNWLATATQTPGTLPDGSTDVLYNGAGGIAMMLPANVVFSQ